MHQSWTTIIVALITILVFVFFIFPKGVNAVDASACQALGFTEALMCSKCEQLKQFVADEELYNDCLKCCAKDDVESGQRYPYATLKTDNGRVFFFPKIDQFIAKRASEFPGLRVKPRAGAYPTLILEDESHQVVQTVSIETWEPHVIADFLKEKLVDGTGLPYA